MVPPLSQRLPAVLMLVTILGTVSCGSIHATTAQSFETRTATTASSTPTAVPTLPASAQVSPIGAPNSSREDLTLKATIDIDAPVGLPGVNQIDRMVFSPDGKILAFNQINPYGETYSLYFYFPETGTTVHSSRSPWTTHLVFTPDSLAFTTADYKDNIIYWDPRTGRPTFDFPSGFAWWGGMAFSPDGKLLALAGDSAVWIKRVNGNITLKGLPLASKWCRRVVFSTDGTRLLAVTSPPVYLYAWDTDTWTEMQKQPKPPGLLLSADIYGEYRADCGYVIRNPITGTLLMEIHCEHCDANHPECLLALSETGNNLAYGAGGEITVVDLKNRISRKYRVPEPVYGIALHEQSHLLAVRSVNSIRLYLIPTEIE